MITQGTNNNVHVALLYRLSNFPCLPLLFSLILGVCCHSKIRGRFIYSSDFTQKKHLAVALGSIQGCMKTGSSMYVRLTPVK